MVFLLLQLLLASWITNTNTTDSTDQTRSSSIAQPLSLSNHSQRRLPHATLIADHSPRISRGIMPWKLFLANTPALLQHDTWLPPGVAFACNHLAEDVVVCFGRSPWKADLRYACSGFGHYLFSELERVARQRSSVSSIWRGKVEAKLGWSNRPMTAKESQSYRFRQRTC